MRSRETLTSFGTLASTLAKAQAELVTFVATIR
jgi:hypothetical protein